MSLLAIETRVVGEVTQRSCEMKMIVISLIWVLIGAALHSLWDAWGKRRAHTEKVRLS